MVWPDLKALTKQEVIRELAHNIAQSLGASDENNLAEILSEREQLGSTGIQDGIAIPHGKIPGLKQIIIACGRSVAGIDFDSHDSKPTHLFFVLLAPEFAAGQHLKALARLSRLLKDESFRQKLLTAGGREAMYNSITAEDKKL